MKEINYTLNGTIVAYQNVFVGIPNIEVIACSYEEDCINQEWAIIQQEKYNEDVDNLRIGMFNAGWWWGISLPYENHPEGGLLVIHHRPLNWEVTFEQPWDFPTQGYNPSPTARESFCPPVPLSARPSWTKHVESDGFEHDSWLVWSWELEN
ncbi:hypothetical protein [Anabaena sp. CCY 0017]|uniref:hypothetical protein n=1 Tax=Anabaena sp. CCY 0017 TaxID=3103866 RepID=UPI0039C75464